MKSFEELYNEIKNNEEMKKAFVSAFREGRTEEFLKAHNCDTSVSDVNAFFNSAKKETASEDDLAKVAGGKCSSFTCGHSCGCDTLDVLSCG